MHFDARVAIRGVPLVRGRASRGRFRLALAELLLRGLGVVLLVASLMKCWAVSRYPLPVSGSILELRAVVWCGIVIEGIVGVVLVSGLWPRGVWWVAVVLFSGFATVAGIEAVAGKDSCGCFGRAEIWPGYMAMFDAFAVVMLGILRMQNAECRMQNEAPDGETRNPQSSIRNARVWIACAIGFAWLSMVASFWGTRPVVAIDTAGAAGRGAGSGAGQTFGKSGELVVLEPEKWIGEKFSLAEDIDVGSQLAVGRWIVLLVHHDCDHCAAAVNRYVKALEDAKPQAAVGRVSGRVSGLAVIEMPPFGEAGDPGPWQLPPGVVSGRLDRTRDWFAATPVAICIDDGVVVLANSGESAEAADPTLIR